MRQAVRILLAVSFLAPTAAPAIAQMGVPSGRTAASLELHGSSTIRLGLWRVLSERIALGAEVGFGFFDGTEDEMTTGSTETRKTDTDIFEFEVGGSVKAYLAESHGIAPYVYVHGGYRATDFEANLTPGPEFGQEFSGFVGRGALGVDWFPNDRVSVGGYAGLRYASASGDATSVNTTREIDQSSLQTISSGIILKLYF